MKSATRNKPNQVRIIGGEWRGRKLSFPSIEGLRPTPDRVRETLFNWLHTYLPDARCLDLFAGSGVLGFEVLSRGARSLTFVENDRVVCSVLQDNAARLDALNRMTLRHEDALEFIRTYDGELFDIILMDPPYGQGLAAECLQLLARGGCLKAGGLLYMEHENDHRVADLPENWLILKNKATGQVDYSLLRAP